MVDLTHQPRQVSELGNWGSLKEIQDDTNNA